MRISYFNYLYRSVIVNLVRNSRLLPLLLYALLFSFSNLFFAQNVKYERVTISVIGGAQIYSQDKALNKQIAQKRVHINGSIIAYHSDDITEKLVITNQKLKKETQKSFAVEVRESVKKKKEKLSEKTRQQLAQYEKRKQDFANEKIGDPFLPDHFFNSQMTSKNYGVPRVENYHSSKIELSMYSYIVKSALDHLHSQYYTFYNNRSFDQCFSKVFSVRPPPVLA